MLIWPVFARHIMCHSGGSATARVLRRRLTRRRWRDRRLGGLQIRLRQLIAKHQRSGMPCRARRTRAAPTIAAATAGSCRNCCPRARRKGRRRWNFGAPNCADIAQPRVRAIAEANAAVALQHLEAIENAAAHIARALERIRTVSRDQDRLLPRLEVCCSVAKPASPSRRLPIAGTETGAR